MAISTEDERSECQAEEPEFCSPSAVPDTASVTVAPIYAAPEPQPIPEVERDDLVNPHWAELENDVGAGPMKRLDKKEHLFFAVKSDNAVIYRLH